MLIRVITNLIKAVTYQERTVVLENFLHLSTLQGLNYLLPLITLPYLIRIIGPERFGLISFAQAFVQYFMILTDYGFNVSATKEISLCREHKEKVCAVFSSVLTVKILLSLASFLIMCAIVFHVPRFRTDWQVYVFSFGAVIGNTLFPLWFFQGTEKMKYIAWLNSACAVALVAGIFLFVHKPADYLVIPILYSSAFLVTGISALCIVFYKFKVRFKPQGSKAIRRQLDAGWNIFISFVAINAYTTTRIFAVGLLTNNVLTGFYSIAERISGFIQTFPLSSWSQAVFPRLSKIYKKNKVRALAIMYKVQDVTNTTALICLPVVFLLAHLAVRVVCGYPYPEVTSLLRILILSLFFVNANAFKVQFLLVSGRTDHFSRIHIGMALIGVPLIFLCILFFSYRGAAIATVFIEMGILAWTSKKISSLTGKT